MSFSVDDLVASLGTSHIGQEQTDLQAFKAQMATQLNQQGSQGVPAPVRRNSLAQPHTTSPAQAGMASEEDREDEMMVEDMLVAPASPTAPAASAAPWSMHNQYQPQLSWAPTTTPAYNQVPTPQYSSPPPPPFGAPQQWAQEQPSLFTTTDPFYLSLTQHAQQSYFSRANHASVFQMDGNAVLVDR